MHVCWTLLVEQIQNGHDSVVINKPDSQSGELGSSPGGAYIALSQPSQSFFRDRQIGTSFSLGLKSLCGYRGCGSYLRLHVTLFTTRYVNSTTL